MFQGLGGLKMTDKQINEFIAEKMFGLVRQKDFGEWEEHDWEKNKDGSIDEWAMGIGYCNGPACTRCHHSFCMHCSDNYEKELHEGPCMVDAPNYIEYYQQVIDKAQAIVIKKQSNRNIFEVYFNGSKAEDKVLGKAICLSAIEYLKSIGGGQR